ncbi:hypothetical protein [Streptomyces sp. JJ36]|uniref:Acg family FMN-binding oxidoreductase n=1 Tax=Streptomyces sp. JJ36 TaxID=2736645 RepID=UPI001F1C8110|nr:hypothetical protein [Streptomyces sp. JJ36]
MPPTTLTAATLEDLISAACAAPSVHDVQPWRYRLDPDTVELELHAAAERAPRRAADPSGRALHVSAGAALLNLRVAAVHAGWEPLIRLVPDPGEPGLLATVRLTPRSRRRRGRGRPDLYDVLWRQHSSPLPFSGPPVPPDVLAELADAAQTEGAALFLPGREESVRLLQLTAEAERRTAAGHQAAENRAGAERRNHTETRSRVRDGRPDWGPTGVPARARGGGGRGPGAAYAGPYAGAEATPDTGLEAAPDTGPDAGDRPRPVPLEHPPALALLTTPHDRRADWLRAGQAVQHVLLVATAHRIRSSLLHQAVEWPDLRMALHPRHNGLVHHPQMLIRLGYGPEGPATPHRTVREVPAVNGSAPAWANGHPVPDRVTRRTPRPPAS